MEVWVTLASRTERRPISQDKPHLDTGDTSIEIGTARTEGSKRFTGEKWWIFPHYVDVT